MHRNFCKWNYVAILTTNAIYNKMFTTSHHTNKACYGCSYCRYKCYANRYYCIHSQTKSLDYSLDFTLFWRKLWSTFNFNQNISSYNYCEIIARQIGGSWDFRSQLFGRHLSAGNWNGIHFSLTKYFIALAFKPLTMAPLSERSNF